MMRWDDKLELGIEALDTQHRRMVELACEVYEAHRRTAGPELLRRLEALANAAAEHFIFEEQLMRETDYAKSAVHSEHHAEILGQLDRFSRHLIAGRYASEGDKAMVFLGEWIASHIQSFDRDFAEHLSANRLSP